MPIALNLSRIRARRYSTIPVPISPQTRIASITPNKIETGQLRRFLSEQWEELENFRPQILLGSASDLQKLASISETGAVDITSVDTAVLAATAWDAAVMTDVERVVLWQAFAVPVYELLLSPAGYLIGSECEAHAGWHLEPGISFVRSSSGTTLKVKQTRERV